MHETYTCLKEFVNQRLSHLQELSSIISEKKKGGGGTKKGVTTAVLHFFFFVLRIKLPSATYHQFFDLRIPIRATIDPCASATYLGNHHREHCAAVQ
mgnify:CR=1 FL=1